MHEEKHESTTRKCIKTVETVGKISCQRTEVYIEECRCLCKLDLRNKLTQVVKPNSELHSYVG